MVRHACRLVGHLAWDEAASAAYARAGATLLIYRTVQAHRPRGRPACPVAATALPIQLLLSERTVFLG